MSFFDEGDDPPTAIRSPQPQPPRPPERARRSSTDDRTLLLRRAGAAGIVLVVLIGIVFGVKAVLDRQAIQGLKDYNNKVKLLVQGESTTVRDQLFGVIDNASNSPNPSQVSTTIQQYVSQERSYYQTAQAWSVPGAMVGAQRQFVQVLGLRYAALQGIGNEMTQALGVSGNQTSAIKLIAGDMLMLSAADVIYAERVAPLITETLTKAGITTETTASSAFLPDIGWVNPATVAQRILNNVPAALGGAPASGSNGHELLSVAVRGSAGDTTLQPGTSTTNTFPFTAAGITFVLTVRNSGTGNVAGVMTKISFHKTGLNLSCMTTPAQIPLTRPGQSYDVTIVLAPLSSCTSFYNQPLQMTAEVVPVRGETDATNNFQHYFVEFTH